MRTSLNEIKLIDQHLFKLAEPGDALLFDAMLILNPQLQEQMIWQKKTHALVQQYGRKKLKNELEAVHQRLFNEPEHRSFRNRILKLFTGS
jgi:hypothetical protein